MDFIPQYLVNRLNPQNGKITLSDILLQIEKATALEIDFYSSQKADVPTKKRVHRESSSEDSYSSLNSEEEVLPTKKGATCMKAEPSSVPRANQRLTRSSTVTPLKKE